VPLLNDPDTVPAEQVAGMFPQTPLMGGVTGSSTEHQAFEPLLPKQVQEVDVPLSVEPMTVPVAHVLAVVPQVPPSEVAPPLDPEEELLLLDPEEPPPLDPEELPPLDPEEPLLLDPEDEPLEIDPPSATEHQALLPLLPRQVQEVDVPLLVEPVTVPVAHVLAVAPQVPLMIGAAGSATEHQAFEPLLPRHVQDVDVPLLVEPLTVPVAHVLAVVPQVPPVDPNAPPDDPDDPELELGMEQDAFVPLLLPLQIHVVVAPLLTVPLAAPVEQLLTVEPHTPLIGSGGTEPSATEHQALLPLLPRQVQEVDVPLLVEPLTVPVAHVLAVVPQVPLTVCAGQRDAALGWSSCI
jgi:hypothetical protein